MRLAFVGEIGQRTSEYGDQLSTVPRLHELEGDKWSRTKSFSFRFIAFVMRP